MPTSSRSGRFACFAGIVASLLGAGEVAHALVSLVPSPFLESIPDPACDLVITPANASVTLLQLDDLDKRVFCIDAGDYRSFGGLTLVASGTAGSPRHLRFHGPGAVKAFQRPGQAIFERLEVQGDHWVVQGLTFRPTTAATWSIVSLRGANHVVLDGNLLDGIEHPNGAYQNGVLIRGLSGAPSADNVVQRNVIRNGDQTHAAVDYTAVMIAPGYAPGETNDRNRVVDNEISDWGDGVGIEGWSPTCSEPEHQLGTVIDGNDLYVTPAKYVDCVTGAANPAGQCACAENGIDVKSPAGIDPVDWTRITRNRIWGMRPTTDAVVCGGSGALGQAVSVGNLCPRSIYVARNLIADSTVGIETAGDGWILASNLIHDIQASDGHIYGTFGIQLGVDSDDVAIQWNTIVRALNAYDDRSSYTDTRCNAVLDSPEWIGPGWPRGTAHTTEYNYLYASGQWNLVGPTNASYPTLDASGNQTLCYERRRWTGPEVVCVADGAAGVASPHKGGTPYCDAAIGAPFGMPTLGYWKNAQAWTCGIGAELALVLGAIGCARQRLRARSPR